MIAEAEIKLTYDELLHQNLQLRHELEQLKRIVFGQKNERFVPTVPEEQLSIGLEVAPLATPAPVLETISYTRKKELSTPAKPHQGRMALPASLPREIVVIEPTQDVSGLKKIGEEITEQLDATPMKLYVRRTIRPKYAKAEGEGILIGTLPSEPIDKCIAGPGLLSSIVIGKYIDHLPLYRQIEIFKRAGITLPSSTVGDWIEGCCKLLMPLYEAHRKEVLESSYLQVDESPIKVLDKDKKGSTHRGYQWVYHSPQNRLVLFDYREGRGREGPEELLKEFKGYLQSDGYEVYTSFENREGIVHLHCMAHARRKFDEALSNDQPRAAYVLSQIQKLYQTERVIREEGLDAQQAKVLRESESLPVLSALKCWLLENYVQVLPQSPIGKAISYSLQRWEKLCVYTSDGDLQIDNNLVENAIRPLAIGRKNYLFAGSHEGARRAAMLYSFMASCKKHDLNPQEWLKNVLENIADWPQKKIQELLPHRWKKNSSNNN
jgi:transposase